MLHFKMILKIYKTDIIFYFEEISLLPRHFVSYFDCRIFFKKLFNQVGPRYHGFLLD
jgi:hypothetical protein